MESRVIRLFLHTNRDNIRFLARAVAVAFDLGNESRRGLDGRDVDIVVFLVRDMTDFTEPFYSSERML